MTDLAPIQPAFPGPSVQPGGAQARTTLSSDFETFLKMLTVQMQNQDPLNPVESSEYAVQLATFSSVEQQVLTNDLLTQLIGQSGAGLSDVAGLVGMDVRVAGPAAYDGSPVAVWAEPALGADQAFLVTRDSAGNEVSRQQITGEGGRISWDGALADGGTALHGTYSFEVESQLSDGSVFDVQPAETYTRVVEVQSTSRGLQLVTQSGDVLPASAVTGLRRG